MDIEYIGDAHKQENHHLSADAFEANLAGKRAIGNGAHHAGNVVDGDEDEECIQQTVTAAEKIAQPASDASKN